MDCRLIGTGDEKEPGFHGGLGDKTPKASLMNLTLQLEQTFIEDLSMISYLMDSSFYIFFLSVMD